MGLTITEVSTYRLQGCGQSPERCLPHTSPQEWGVSEPCHPGSLSLSAEQHMSSRKWFFVKKNNHQNHPGNLRSSTLAHPGKTRLE